MVYVPHGWMPWGCTTSRKRLPIFPRVTARMAGMTSLKRPAVRLAPPRFILAPARSKGGGKTRARTPRREEQRQGPRPRRRVTRQRHRRPQRQRPRCPHFRCRWRPRHPLPTPERQPSARRWLRRCRGRPSSRGLGPATSLSSTRRQSLPERLGRRHHSGKRAANRGQTSRHSRRPARSPGRGRSPRSRLPRLLSPSMHRGRSPS
mmetsp:Transcript_65527/g.176392  ORF Transcript_65527/g.176392 Transcript_65527/m.176392 type:complete len:205 (+) Transcript_65527:1-615(+)